VIVSLDNYGQLQTTWFLGAGKAIHDFSSSLEISCFLGGLEERIT